MSSTQHADIDMAVWLNACNTNVYMCKLQSLYYLATPSANNQNFEAKYIVSYPQTSDAPHP